MPLTAGSELKQLREMAGFSQYELATRTQIGREKISRFECGYTEPSTEERRKLEAAINQAIAEQLALLAELRSGKRSACRTSAQGLAMNT